MGEIFDFTKYRKGRKVGLAVIDYCPKCGRKGLKKVFDKWVQYNHVEEFKGIYFEVKEHCRIKNKGV